MGKKFLCFLVFMLLASASFAKPLTSEDDLTHGRIATWPGSMAMEYAGERFPNAQFEYFDTAADMAQNVRQKKADAFAMNRLFVDEILTDGTDDLEILGDSLGKSSFSFVFTSSSKGKKLCDEFNAFLQTSRENGDLSHWQEKWLTQDKSRRIMEDIPLTGERGILSVVINPIFPPLLYIQENKTVGFEMELWRRFCAAYGYDYKTTISHFESALAGVNTGQFDVGISAVENTSERTKSIIFSDKTCEADCVLVVRSDGGTSMGPAASLKKKFSDSFFRESRWKIFAGGLLTTIVITFVSVLCGTLIGFAECLLYRENYRRLNNFLDLTSRLFAGTPVVVLLMIFYYIVFGGIDISGTLVAIVAFSLLFGFSVFDMLKNAVANIPKGQTEGALALGFSERQTFLRFIVPQAVRQAFSVYQGEIIGLVKATAIVGYIAVQDLTKAADIVRAQTFDAFMPLIIITFFYLIFVWLLQKTTAIILRQLDPTRRSKETILRGITP